MSSGGGRITLLIRICQSTLIRISSIKSTLQVREGRVDDRGDGRVSSKTAFNLLGGYIEFDMDVMLRE